MIELPRACFVAGDIARHAEFFSFGTNDLTQTALGFSRDDIEGRIVPLLHGRGHRRALAVRDASTRRASASWSGWRSSAAARRARSSWSASAASTAATRTRSASSTRAGLDYVSCSPFRVPIARVAAAQAAT